MNVAGLRVAGLEVGDLRPVGGGDICRAYRGRTPDGRPLFVKVLAAAPPGFFTAEVRGLDLLRVPGGPPVPVVLAADAHALALDWVEPGAPSRAAAESFGRALAALHATRVAAYGAAHDGFIGSLPLDNRPAPRWAEFYVERRVAPFLEALTAQERASVERLCSRIDSVAGPEEGPARIHGDLWSGNLLWAGDGQVWLVDAAAAHGGHRETDLAMLALFGAPHLDVITAAYVEVAPPADGWRDRVPLHHVHPLLVHAALFGGGYGARAADAARRALHG